MSTGADKSDRTSRRHYDITPLKNDGSNFQTWKFRMKMILRSRKVWDIVTGTRVKPDPSDAAALAEWEEHEMDALTTIVLTLEDDPLNGVASLQTSKEAWEGLSARYEGKGAQSIVLLIGALFQEKLDDEHPLETQLNTMIHRSQILASLGIKIDESVIAAAMILALPDSYSTLRSILTATFDKPETEKVKNSILAEERSRLSAGSVSATVLKAHMKGKPQQQTKSGKGKEKAQGKKEKCKFCRCSGHVEADCRKKKAALEGLQKDSGESKDAKPTKSSGEVKAKFAHTRRASDSSGSIRLFVTRKSTTAPDCWIIDSGASEAMTPNRSWFAAYKAFEKPRRVWLGDKSFILAHGAGRIILTTQSQSRKQSVLEDVYYVPKLDGNLISVSRLTRRGYKFAFTANDCRIFDPNGDLAATGHEEEGLFVLDAHTHAHRAYFTAVNSRTELDLPLTAYIAKQPNSKADLGTWHRRLGHTNFDSILKMYREGMVEGMEIMGSTTPVHQICTHCLAGKQTRNRIPKESTVTNRRILYRVYSDVCGKMRVLGRKGEGYFATFTDGKSEHVTVSLMKAKDETLDNTKRYITRAEVTTGKRVNFFRSDGGGEYGSHEFKGYLDSKGIHHEKTNAYTPQENGVSERMNRTLLNLARAMLSDAGLPMMYWTYAVLYAAKILNATPTRTVQTGKTPEEEFTGNKPDLTRFRVFGCKVYMHVPDEKRHKLQAKTIEGVNLGFAENKRAYVVLHRPTGRIFESRDIVFDEGLGTELTRVQILVPPKRDNVATEGSEGLEEEFEVQTLDGEASAESGDDHELPAEPEPEPQPQPTSPPRRPTRTRKVPIRDDDERYSRSSYQRSKPKQLGASEEVGVSEEVGDLHANLTSVYDDPYTYKEAMSSPDAPEWQAACIEELRALEHMKVYEVVDRPKDRKVVASKWVFRTKRNSEGEITRYKARVVAKGYTQVEGLDYDETFAPVVKYPTIRALLALAAALNLEMRQLDVKTAFLHGDLKEEIYMSCPPGFEAIADKVLHLLKSIYGLKQASREWYQKLKKEFESMGFTRAESDHALFYKTEGDTLLIVAVYVDDMLLLSDKHSSIDKLTEDLRARFEITVVGEPRWLLGMEITRDRARRIIEVSQRQYVEAVLKHFGMTDCRPTSTPVAANTKLPKLVEAEADIKSYQSRLGAVMYCMLGTRPDLAYAVAMLSQHSATPGKEHHEALTRIFHYLRKTTDTKLRFDGMKKPELLGYVDADWANDLTDRRSITGHVFLMCGGAISWCSQKQKVVAQSSTEAEYISGASATNEALWLRQLLSQVGQPQAGPTRLLTDNQASIALASNPVFHKRTKHIDVRYHHMRHSFEAGFISPLYIPTGDQVADILTKGLPREKHEKFSKGMGLVLPE